MYWETKNFMVTRFITKIHLIAVVWNQTCKVAEAYLYQFSSVPFRCWPYQKPDVKQTTKFLWTAWLFSFTNGNAISSKVTKGLCVKHLMCHWTHGRHWIHSGCYYPSTSFDCLPTTSGPGSSKVTRPTRLQIFRNKYLVIYPMAWPPALPNHRNISSLSLFLPLVCRLNPKWSHTLHHCPDCYKQAEPSAESPKFLLLPMVIWVSI